MNQPRLNIKPRKISGEEENHRANLDAKALSIRHAYEELNRFVQLQAGPVGEPDELPIETGTSQTRIKTMIRNQKKYIKRLEKEYQQLKQKDIQVQTESQKQSTLNL